MDFITQNMMLIAIAVISGGMLFATSIKRPATRNELDPTQATLLINREEAQVIDVRELDDYVLGHLPESRNMPLSSLESRSIDLQKLKETPVIVVCQTGTRSTGACTKLTELGLTKVYSLSGGIAAWRAAGLPLKKGAKK